MLRKNVEQHRFLVRVVVVEERLGDAASLRDHVDRGAGIAMLGEKLGRAMQDGRPLGVIVSSACASHPGYRPFLRIRRIAKIVRPDDQSPGRSALPERRGRTTTPSRSSDV